MPPKRPSIRFETAKFYWRTVITHNRKATAIIMLLMVASATLSMITVGLTVPLLDALTDPARAQANPVVRIVEQTLMAVGLTAVTSQVIFALLVVVCTLFILQGGLMLLQMVATASVALSLRRKIKAALFDRFLRAPYEETSQQARGTIVHHITQASEAIHMGIINVGQYVAGIMTCVLMVAMMFYLSWWATVLTGVLAVSGVLSWRRYAHRRSIEYGKQVYDLRGEQSKIETDAIDGVRVVKSLGLETLIGRRQQAMLDGEKKPTLGLAFLRYAPGFVNEIIACVMILGLGAATFFLPDLGIRFSMMVAFFVAVRRVAPAMAQVSASSVELNKYRRSLQIADDILQKLPQESLDGKPLARIDRVELWRVGFTYAARPEQPVLKNVNLALSRGAITAVVGSSGAGKSTIALLLLRLIEPTEGSVRVNGMDLRKVDLSSWRSKIGYVSQDTFVFNSSIKDNIAFGQEISDQDVAAAARVAQLHDFVTQLPEGYETVVGDRGLRLSGGQCQRLAIARAILRKPEVLILDEATSALDNLTERAVYEAIRTLRKEAVVFVIAHRLSTVRDADQIIVLEAGEMIESGTHEALMGQGGPYARLYREDKSVDEAISAHAAEAPIR